MEQQWENEKETRFPGEVVEVYRQPEYREVVETYSAPLPAGMKRQALCVDDEIILPAAALRRRR